MNEVQLYSIGEVIDNLNDGEVAVSISDKDIGTIIKLINGKYYTSVNGTEEFHRDFYFSRSGKINKRYMIFKSN